MPGRWVLAFARIVFSDTVVTRVVEPAVADFRDEWLRAGSGRSARVAARWRGYVALCSVMTISPFLFWDSERRTDMSVRSRTLLVVGMIIIGLGTGYVVARMQPPMYRSTAVIQVIPAKVPERVLEMGLRDPDSVAARLQGSTELILSRTRLERIIKEFNLYPSEQQSMIMEDIVARMRKRIVVQVVPSSATRSQFEISYTGSDPTTVLKVTEKLASYFIDESLKTSVRRAEGTMAFLESRIQETAARLAATALEVERAGNSAAAMPKRLELEVIQNSYRTLLTRREESSGLVDLERRQIGEQFNLIDPARRAERPIGPTRTATAMVGALAGLTAALLVLLVDVGRRRLLRRQNSVPREAV